MKPICMMSMLLAAMLLTACGMFMPDEGHLGQPCTAGGVCIDGSICSGGICANPANPDGDTHLDGDGEDGDVITDGDIVTDGDGLTDGDTVEGGDALTDGDVVVDGDEESCVPTSHASSACDLGDVYWYDSCGSQEEKKEECDAAWCCDGACVFVENREFPCCGGICTDPDTGFEWQETPTSEKMKWDAAKIYCQNLTLAGGGWHLPNISELRSLVRNCVDIETDGACGVSSEDACLLSSCWSDSSCVSSSCSDDGGPTGCYWPRELSGTCNWYWSSSLVEDDNRIAWYVEFNFGHVSYYSVQVNRYVRCLR